MANISIDIDDLADEITLAVREYAEDVSAAIAKEVDERSKELVENIRNDSPEKTEEYKKGWARKKLSYGEGETAYVVYNKNKPWLAHLLENGHAKRGGGRVAGRPHIRPNMEQAEKQLLENIEKIIRNGG